MFIDALCVTERLIRFDWNKILSMKRFFMNMNIETNGGEDFRKLIFKAETER